MQVISARHRDILTTLALIAFTIVLSLLYTHHRILWSDELFGWMLVTDPSLSHMLHAWNAGADGGGILFYLLARLWLALFGHTATAFRLFSAAGVAIGATFTFRLARRLFSWPVAILSVALVWFSSDVILWQLMQARFYGLLLAAVAAACYTFALTSEYLTLRLLLFTFLCHTLLAGTHPFGLLYSATILLAAILSDLLAHHLRPRLYLSMAAGWWIILPSLPAMRASAAVGRPHFWTSTPTLADLGNTYACWSLANAIVLGAVSALLLLLLCLGRSTPRSLRAALTAPRPLLLLTLALLAIPLLVFVASQFGQSLFVDRYLAPIVLPTSLILCQLLHWLHTTAFQSQRSRLRTTLSFAGLAAIVALLTSALIRFPIFWTLPSIDNNLTLLPLLPRGVPIVVQPVDLFDQLLAYHRAEGYTFVHLLDWQDVTAPDSPRGAVSGFHEMENWRAVGYFSGSIQPAGSFLSQTPAFVVLDTPASPWFNRRIRPDPAFNKHLLGTLRRGPNAADLAILWMIQRRTAQPPTHANPVSPEIPPDR